MADVMTYALWIAGFVLQGTIAILLLRSNRYREYPVFVAYTILHLARNVVLLAIYGGGSYRAYFYSYWAAEAIDAVMVLLVIQEVFTKFFRVLPVRSTLGTTVFRFSILISLGLAILLALLEPGNESSRLIAGLLVMQRTVSIVQCGSMLVLIVVIRYLRVGTREFGFYIGLGLGLQASLAMAVTAMRAYMPEFDTVYRLAFAATYKSALVVWLWALAFPAKRAALPELRFDVQEVRRWNEVLTSVLRR